MIKAWFKAPKRVESIRFQATATKASQRDNVIACMGYIAHKGILVLFPITVCPVTSLSSDQGVLVLVPGSAVTLIYSGELYRDLLSMEP